MRRVSLMIGIALTVAITIAFRVTTLDLDLQRLVFSAAEPHWPYASAQPWKGLHDTGTLPGLVLALFAVGVLAVSLRREEWLRWQNSALYTIAFLAIGPGLVTNLLGKMAAGRPRPDEVAQFGGALQFHRPFDFGVPGRGYSFLCGHCSMGFLWFVFFFLLIGWRRWLALVFASSYGVALGLARVIQGAHFVSDVLLDGSIMFVIAASLTPLLERRPLLLATAHRRKIVAVTAAAALGITCAFLFSTPIRKEEAYAWINQGQAPARRFNLTVLPWRQPATNRAPAALRVDVEGGDIEIHFRPAAEPLVVESLVRGFGFPGADVKTDTTRSEDGTIVSYRQRLTGMYWEAHATSGLLVSTGLRSLRASTGRGRIVVDRTETTNPLRVITSAQHIQWIAPWRRRGKNIFEAPDTGVPLTVVLYADEVLLR